MGSLIVGGRATVQSFINNSFHSEYSKHVVDTQVSFGFEYTKLHLSLDNDAKSVHEKMMHEYLNNSNAKTTFQPGTGLPILKRARTHTVRDYASTNNR